MVLPGSVGDRQQLFQKLEEMTVVPEASGGQAPFALILIKLDHFRRYNLTKGYQAADKLLSIFTQSLQSILRPQDYLARVGNAEFVLLLAGISNEGFANLAATKLFDCLKDSQESGLQNVYMQAHAGVTLFPEHATGVVELMKRAETALDIARHQLEPFAIYQDDDKASEGIDWGIQNDLNHAIELDQFELYFQPQISLKDGKLYGAEALLRWKNEEKGFVRPDVFIPIAEKTGQIVEITEWTLNSALWFLEEWCRQSSPIKVAVNISTKMLSEPDFGDIVRNSIALYGVDPQFLTLEITESALLEDMSSSVAILEDLRQLGVNVSIDDFGTGYSSLAYFKGLPANELKIDRSFIQYMLENQMDQHIVKTVIQLAHGFDLEVVAEGVEDEQSNEFLKQIGCDISQGYFIAKPMPTDDFLAWVSSNYKDFELS